MSTKNVLLNGVDLSRTNFVHFPPVANQDGSSKYTRALSNDRNPDIPESDEEVEARWKAFGAMIKAEREHTGITQEQLAEGSGVHAKTISRIENGEPTKRSTVIKLAECLGIIPQYALEAAFVKRNDNRVMMPDPILEAIGEKGELSKADEIMVANFIRTLKAQRIKEGK